MFAYSCLQLLETGTLNGPREHERLATGSTYCSFESWPPCQFPYEPSSPPSQPPR